MCVALEIIATANLSIEPEFLCLLNINILKVCILYLYQALHRWRIQSHHLIYFLQPSCEEEIVSNIFFFSYIRKQFPSSSMIYPKLSHCTWWVEKEAGQLYCLSWDPYPSALLNFTRNAMVGAGSPCPLAFWWGCRGRLESRIAMGEEGEPRPLPVLCTPVVSLVVVGSSEAPAPDHSPSITNPAAGRQPWLLDSGNATCFYCPSGPMVTRTSCCR